jgi:hypothetical protein
LLFYPLPTAGAVTLCPCRIRRNAIILREKIKIKSVNCPETLPIAMGRDITFLTKKFLIGVGAGALFTPGFCCIVEVGGGCFRLTHKIKNNTGAVSN